MTPGLAALIDPGAVVGLLERFRSDLPFVAHGRREALAPLFALPLLASLDAVLGAWPDQVHVHLPDVADEARSITASPHDAARMFASGMGLRFDDAERYAPALMPWLATIRAELGLSALTQARCLIYATPAGKGTAAHFDQNVNLVLQLHGTKTWWLAANTHAPRPLARHTMGQDVQAELGSYARLPMPATMPADRTEVVLAPGSVLLVPRGVWHATHAAEDALALNFTFTPPTWIDVFTAALRSRLALSADWRATAQPRSVASFEALLRDLADDAQHWHAADILDATEGGAGAD